MLMVWGRLYITELGKCSSSFWLMSTPACLLVFSLSEMLASANQMYLNPLHRLTPYLFGMMLGYIIRTHGSHIKLTQVIFLPIMFKLIFFFRGVFIWARVQLSWPGFIPFSGLSMSPIGIMCLMRANLRSLAWLNLFCGAAPFVGLFSCATLGKVVSCVECMLHFR